MLEVESHDGGEVAGILNLIEHFCAAAPGRCRPEDRIVLNWRICDGDQRILS
jgi:hypothetical protein